MSSLDRLINLVKKTGDRLVIHDSATDEDVVIMDLSAYEALHDPQLKVSQHAGAIQQDFSALQDEAHGEWADDDDSFDLDIGISSWSSTREILNDWPAKSGIDDKEDLRVNTDWAANVDTWDDQTRPAAQADSLESLSLNMNQETSPPTRQDDGDTLGAEEPIFYEEPV